MKIITTFLLILMSLSLNAQIPENFEILDHNQRWSNLGANYTTEDSIIFVSHNGQWPMTTVKIAYKNNELKTIFESPFSGESKRVHNQDGSTDIFIYRLFDYDVGLPGFYVIHINDGKYTVEKFVDETFETINYDFYAHDIIRDVDSTFWLIGQSDLVKVSNGEAESLVDLGQNYNQNLFKNSNGEGFIYKDESIFHINQDSLVGIIEFISKIKDITIYEGNNLVLLEDNLVVFNSDFTSLISTWDLPTPVPSFEYLQMQEDKLFLLSVEDEVYELFEVDNQGNDDLILSGTNENELARGFNILNDSSFLFKGHLQQENAYRNIFYRNTSMDADLEYIQADISLQEFKLVRTGKDSIFCEIIFNGDSIFYYDYDYDYSVSFMNNSDFNLYSANIFSRQLVNTFGPNNIFVNIELVDTLSPGESLTVSGSINVPLTGSDLSGTKIFAPGANNRFNSNPINSIVADYTSSIYHPELLLKPMDVFPNPCTDFISLDPGITVSQYLIYDMNGILVQGGSKVSNRIDVSLLSPGTYIIRASEESGRVIQLSRFIKQ